MPCFQGVSVQQANSRGFLSQKVHFFEAGRLNEKRSAIYFPSARQTAHETTLSGLFVFSEEATQVVLRKDDNSPHVSSSVSLGKQKTLSKMIEKVACNFELTADNELSLLSPATFGWRQVKQKTTTRKLSSSQETTLRNTASAVARSFFAAGLIEGCLQFSGRPGLPVSDSEGRNSPRSICGRGTDFRKDLWQFGW